MAIYLQMLIPQLGYFNIYGTKSEHKFKMMMILWTFAWRISNWTSNKCNNPGLNVQTMMNFFPGSSWMANGLEHEGAIKKGVTLWQFPKVQIKTFELWWIDTWRCLPQSQGWKESLKRRFKKGPLLVCVIFLRIISGSRAAVMRGLKHSPLFLCTSCPSSHPLRPFINEKWWRTIISHYSWCRSTRLL